MRFDRLRLKQALGLAMTAWVLTFSAPPRVQAEPPARKPAQDDVTSYSFDDDTVHGDLYNPLGEVLQVRRRPVRESLIRARDSFVRELLKSVEAL